MRPCCMRKGSYTSSTVSGSSASADAKRGKPHRTAAELHAEHLQKAVVHGVEPQMVHLEERERLRRPRPR